MAYVRCVAGGSVLPLDFTYDASTKVLTVRKPGVNMASDFTMQLQ